MKKNNTEKNLKVKTFTAVILIFLFLFVVTSNGCIKKENDVFFVSNNYEDETKIKELIFKYEAGLNARNVSQTVDCFDSNLNFPDEINQNLNVTYRTLLYDYKDFFQKIEKINYKFNDQYLLLNEQSAKLTMKLHKEYTAISPFTHQVNADLDETVTITKNSAGAWKITKIKELLPPRIY